MVALAILISSSKMIFTGFGRLLRRFGIWQDNNQRGIFKGSKRIRAILLTSKAWQRVKRCWGCQSVPVYRQEERTWADIL